MAIMSSVAVVEDDESVREAITGLLRSLGFTAMGFPSASAFLSSDFRHRTLCLVSDVHMSEMSGIALYEHLLATGTSIPTILITAYPDDNVRAQAFNSGAAGYLIKPFSEKDLLDCVDTASRRSG
jgi:FixJ family two-component response regulator